MRELPLHDIIAAHTDALAAHADEFLPMIRFLLLLGEQGRVTPDRLAAALHTTPTEAEAFIRSSGLVFDAKGEMHPAPGAGCALDRLLFPLLTGRVVHIVATCPASGRAIRLTVTPDGVEELDPPSAAVSLRLPDREVRAETVQGAICAYGHFFADREHAATWPRLHPVAVLLSVGDATLLACEIAIAARRYAEETRV